MTEREAIFQSLEMWKWLARNPGKSKEDYLKEKEIKEEWVANCACCEYYESCMDINLTCPLEAWHLCEAGNGAAYYIWSSLMKHIQSGNVEIKDVREDLISHASSLRDELQYYWDANFEGNDKEAV